MVITEKNIFPAIKDGFRRQGNVFIDLNGNVNIETDTMLIKVEGKQQKYLQQRKLLTPVVGFRIGLPRSIFSGHSCFPSLVIFHLPV
jgi:hypothetical protein